MIDRFCRECWVEQVKRSVRLDLVKDIQTRYTTRPHWMQLPGREYLTTTETHLLDRISEFLGRTRIGMRVVLGLENGLYKGDRDNIDTNLDGYSKTAFIQTVEEPMNRDEWEHHPLKDWCIENGVEWDDRHTEFTEHVSFLLPRRDGRRHADVDPDTGMTIEEYRDSIKELHALSVEDE